MADIVNLRQARKVKARKEKEATAAENRVRFGRTRAERDEIAAREAKAARLHDSHKLQAHKRQDGPADPGEDA